MEFIEHLRSQKREGESELAARLAEEEARKAEEAAKAKAHEEHEKALQRDKDQRQADSVFARLPEIVKEAARQGHKTAVLSEGSISDRPSPDRPSHAVNFNRRTFYLTGWQIPFYERCKLEHVPLTIVSERVNSGINRVLHKEYHFLAIDIDLI